MLSERVLTKMAHTLLKDHLEMSPTNETHLPAAKPGQKYMLYLHVPFCQRLCPYCSFNRYPFHEDMARHYFKNLRREMMMLKDLGYDFESLYFGGGTPTIMLDELCKTIDLARENYSIKDVAVETNPNHLVEPWLSTLSGRVQRLSVGVQSFNDDLLKQMDRYEKYGSGEEIFDRIGNAATYFDSLNVDMIFNFPSQTEDILFNDLEKIVACGAQQTTFSPLYVSNATIRKMSETLGTMDYDRERRFYQIVDGVLAGGDDPFFKRSTLWTFTRNHMDASNLIDDAPQIEEYQTNYDEYPAIGSGSITHLNGCLYVNTFSLRQYNEAIEQGRMPIMGKRKLTKHDLMCYRFLVDLYKLRLDKDRFRREFGVSVEAGLPFEMAWIIANGAFATNDAHEITLTPKGRYYVLVIYREFLSGMNNLRDQARHALTGIEHELLFGDGTPEA